LPCSQKRTKKKQQKKHKKTQINSVTVKQAALADLDIYALAEGNKLL
jgi:hypothetical protein